MRYTWKPFCEIVLSLVLLYYDIEHIALNAKMLIQLIKIVHSLHSLSLVQLFFLFIFVWFARISSHCHDYRAFQMSFPSFQGTKRICEPNNKAIEQNRAKTKAKSCFRHSKKVIYKAEAVFMVISPSLLLFIYVSSSCFSSISPSISCFSPSMVFHPYAPSAEDIDR